MTTAAVSGYPGHLQVRERWQMSVEAKALTLVTAVLIAFGLAVLYSASAIAAMQAGKGSAFFLLRQLTGVAAGLVAFAIAAKLDAELWQKWAWPVMGATLVVMLVIILPFTPQWLAPRIHGSRRFLLGGSLQPSEFGKIAVIVWTAMLVVKKGDTLRRLTKGLMPFLVVIGTLCMLAALEPDLSVAMLYALLMATVLYAGGVRIGHFIALALLGAPVLWKAAVSLQYVLARLTVFLDPGAASEQVSYQLRQSLIAVGSGGLTGVGFGQGRQQFGFVPFPYNDFVASNIGEEWGFLGLLFVIVAFSLYAWLGFRIAQLARSRFLKLVAVGLTTATVMTAFLHVGVVIGLLPTTGLTLPFISYGRSNLVLSLLMTGTLINIGSTRERVYGAQATDPLADE
jgi:cell division protein FtsW